jgi:hypothetical protein
MLQVKLSLALLSSSAVLGAFSGSAEDILPPRFSFDRYTPMANHSPFAIATAVALPEATPDFAKDLYIANAARSSDGDMVTIRSSSDQNFKKYLTTREPVDGYGIAQIEWSEDVGKTKVTISKDGKFATLTFNQSLLSKSASSGPPTPGQLPQSVPLVSSPDRDEAAHARKRSMIQQNPKTAAIPTRDLEEESRPNLPPLQQIDPEQQLRQDLQREEEWTQQRRKKPEVRK